MQSSVVGMTRRADPPAGQPAQAGLVDARMGAEPGTTGPELLTAWRAVERRYARMQAGTDEASRLHAEMRRLMDDYEWTVRGSVARPRDGRALRGR